MKKNNKGCPNVNCEVHKKMIRLSSDILTCPSCGSALTYVCKNCYTQLPDDSEPLCILCQEEKSDKWENRKNKGKKVGAGLFAGVVGLLLISSDGEEESSSNRIEGITSKIDGISEFLSNFKKKE